MTWNDIDTTNETREQAEGQAKERQAQELELCKKFKRVFSSQDGQAVFNHLFQKFVMQNATQLNAPNPNYEAAYHNGESGVIHYITNKMTKAGQ